MSGLTQLFEITRYHLNPYAVAPLLVATLVLIFGFFLNNLEKNSNFNKALVYFCLSSGVWLYSCVVLLNAKTANIALFWSHFLYVGFIMMPASVFHLSVNLTDRYDEQKYAVISAYAVAFVLLPLARVPYFFTGVKKDSFGYYPQAGEFQTGLFWFFGICFLASLANLIHYHFKSVDTQEKNRMKLFIFSFLVLSLSIIDLLTTYEFYFYPSGFIAFLGFIVGITCFKMMFYTTTINRHSQNLEKEVERKTRKISQVLDELKTTQVKLLETGKKSALASLSAGILHQISQPITAIHGFVRFIKKEIKKTDPFYKPICLIEEQSVYIKKMLENLMNLVRHREIKKENVNVNTIIEKALGLLEDEMKIRHVKWELNLDKEIPHVFADSVHLQQVFLNLVINAIQSMDRLPKNAVRQITIETKINEDEDHILISFADTGPAMSEENKQAIAEPFFSLTSDDSGIGLALCQDLIAEHSGRIDVESDPGEGSRFIIQLPVADVETVSK